MPFILSQRNDKKKRMENEVCECAVERVQRNEINAEKLECVQMMIGFQKKKNDEDEAR